MLDPLRPDLDWLGAWIFGRALARGLPTPFRDVGGWRAEIGSGTEKRRWLFAGITPELLALAGRIAEPGLKIRAFCEPAALQDALPPRWCVEASSYAMAFTGKLADPLLPDGFRLDLRIDSLSAHAAIITQKGELAASGHAGIGTEAFVYDRIVTQPDYRRRGLGTAIMGALAKALPGGDLPQLLVATEGGRMLYSRLGWQVVSPYASAERVGEQSTRHI